jgi:hypothetical protein
MKNWKKHLIYNTTVLVVLLFFFVFSSGLSFSLHYCDSCGQTKAFFIEHPNCCSESAQIHDSEKKCSNNCGCCENEQSQNANSCCSAKHHCKTTHKFIRINSPYVVTSHSGSQPLCLDIFTLLSPTEAPDIKISFHFPQSANPPPTITQAGGDRFLNYISQHLFYS